MANGTTVTRAKHHRRLTLQDFLGSATTEVRVLIEPETAGNVDIPPREGRVGDVVFEPYAPGAGMTAPWPSPMPTSRTRLHPQSCDCWSVVTAPTVGVDAPHRTRIVRVSDPYDRYRHGSSIDAWRERRQAELQTYGLGYQEAERVVDHELGAYDDCDEGDGACWGGES